MAWPPPPLLVPEPAGFVHLADQATALAEATVLRLVAVCKVNKSGTLRGGHKPERSRLRPEAKPDG